MDLSSSLALDNNSYKGWLALLERLLEVQQKLVEVDGVVDDKKKYRYPFPFLRSPFSGIKVAGKVLF